MRHGSRDDEEYSEVLDYLLGDLADDRAEEFERRYLSDHEAFERFEAIEEDLIEDCLRGELSPEKRPLFEQRYLDRPENREKVDFARRLIDCVSSEQRQHDSTPMTIPAYQTQPRASLFYSKRLAAAVSIGLILLLGIGTSLVIYIVRLNARLAAIEKTRVELERTEQELQSRLEAEQDNNKALAKELQQVRDHLSALQRVKPSATVLSLLLPLSAGRGPNQSREARLTQSIATLDLKLDVSRFDFQTYQVTVRPLSGGFTATRDNLKPAGAPSAPVLEIRLPTANLKPGEYAVTLYGVIPTGESKYAGEYLFTIVRD